MTCPKVLYVAHNVKEEGVMITKTILLTLVLLGMFFALATIAPSVEAYECRYIYINGVPYWVCS